MSEPTRQTVLIIEDDIGIAILERKRLERAGYEVLQATTGERALEMLRECPVHLILLDYRLAGGMNGLEFCSHIKDLCLEIPVILVTGNSDQSQYFCTNISTS